MRDTLGSYAPSFYGSRQEGSIEYSSKSSQSNANSRLSLSTTPWGKHNAMPPSEMPSSVAKLNVNMSLRSTLELELQVTQLDSADMEYLKAKGAFDLPPRSLQEDLVKVFFADIHPTAPVINRAEFLSSFYGNGQPSRLLLFALFTSASRACRNPALLDNRGTNQGSAQRFYKATRVSKPRGSAKSRS